MINIDTTNNNELVFKGTNTDQQNHIQELEIDGVTLTADEKIADGSNKYFSNIGPILNLFKKLEVIIKSQL